MAVLERAGAAVMLLSGTGVPDLLVWHRQRLYLVEVKRPKAPGQRAGRPTKAQEARRAQGWPVHLVQSIDDALHLLGA